MLFQSGSHTCAAQRWTSYYTNVKHFSAPRLICMTHWWLLDQLRVSYAWIAVTLLDTRTAPGELKWAASPSEGGVSGSSSSPAGTPFTTCSLFWPTDSIPHPCAWSTSSGRIVPPLRKATVVLSANTSCVVWQRSRRRPAWWWV